MPPPPEPERRYPVYRDPQAPPVPMPPWGRQPERRRMAERVRWAFTGRGEGVRAASDGGLMYVLSRAGKG